ncbi:MAG: TRAP transporter small permease [Thermoleophilia bacterium]
MPMRILARFTGALDWLAGIVVLGSMVLVVGNVVLRLLGSPIRGSYEWTGFLIAVAIGLALAYCAIQGGHASIALLVDRFPVAARTRVRGVIGVLVAGFLVLTAWRVFLLALSTKESGQVAATTEIPFYPMMFLVAGGTFAYGLVEIAKSIQLLVRGEGPGVIEADDSVGETGGVV